MKRFLSAFLAFVLLIAPIGAQTVTPQIGGGIGQGFDGGVSAPVTLKAAPSSNPRYSTFTDSWAAQQFTDGGQTIQSAQSPLTWWQGLSGQNPILVNNTGVSGQRSDQWFARLPAILADASKWVYVTTPQNDIGQAFGGYTAGGGPYSGQAVTMANVNAVIQANYTAFIQSIIAAGKTPIMLSAPGATNFVASQITARNVFNAWLQPYCVLTNSVFIDARNILTDGSLVAVTYLPNMAMPDGGHPNNLGSYTLGKAMAANSAFSIMTPRNVLPISTASGQTFGTQFLLNNLYQTTTGGSGSTDFAGDDPASFSWGAAGTAATVAASHAAGTFGNDIIRTETYTGAVAQEMRHNQTILTGLGSATGKIVQATAQFDVAASPVNFLGPDLRGTWTVGGVTTTLIDLFWQVASAGPGPTEAYTYTALTPAAPTSLIVGTPVQGIAYSLRTRSNGLGSGSAVITERRAGLYLR